MKTTFIKSLKQAIGIVLVATMLGISYNSFSKHGIPFFLKSKKVAEEPVGGINNAPIVPKEPLIINLEQTYQLFQKKSAFIIDAREPKDFEPGHIPGAQNIPWLNPDELSIPADLDKSQLIIIYCSDLGCEKSIEMAFYLYEKGFGRIRIFQGGWEEWTKAGHPTEKGKSHEN